MKNTKEELCPQKRTEKWLNIPNLCSILRVVMIPFFVYLFFSERLTEALILLIASGLTDLADGWIARHFHQITALGKFLDPFADKLTQATVGVCMMIAYRSNLSIILLFAFFFLKELLMTIGGIVLRVRRIKILPSAKWYGKVATVSFYVSICIVIFCKAVLHYEKLWVVWFCVGMTAVLMLNAFIRYFGMFRQICSGKYDFSKELPSAQTQQPEH